MKRIIIHILLAISVTGLLISCSWKNQFTVKGTINDGHKKVLYFENVSATNVIILDSVKINKSGSYKFKHNSPEAPDFYRLRLNHQFINFSVDSTEIITINSDTLNFAKSYTVEGSYESENIKLLTFLQLKTSEIFNQLQKQYRSQTITSDEYSEQVKICVNNYKEEAINYILTNPASASAYFALFQQINSLLIFDPYDRADSKFYGSVANNWNQKFPDAPRTKHLVNLFTNSLMVLRGEKTQNIDIDANAIDSKEYFDISLLSYNNIEYRLSDIGKNKVVLLEFISYDMKEILLHNQEIARIYGKYNSKGFEIYQVSLDIDEHIWKNRAINLPWFCVIDPKSVNSDILRRYNIREIPTGFLLDKQGDIVKRVEDYTKLEEDILLLLK